MAQVRENMLSRINEVFDMDTKLELYQVAMSLYGSANSRSRIVDDILKRKHIDFMRLAPGTNRYGVKIDDYCFKIALDYDGMIDNLREFKYTKILYPYVIKVYETIPNGLIESCEYVNSLNPDEWVTEAKIREMREILRTISSQFLIGDIGTTAKNRANWGVRDDGSLCILDFAYIYDIKYNKFTCTCDHKTPLQYDDDFVLLKCPKCGRLYEFGEMRKRIHRDEQKYEIGDVRSQGYCLQKAKELVVLNPEFSKAEVFDKSAEKKAAKRELKETIKKAIKEDNKRLKLLRNPDEIY